MHILIRFFLIQFYLLLQQKTCAPSGRSTQKKEKEYVRKDIPLCLPIQHQNQIFCLLNGYYGEDNDVYHNRNHEDTVISHKTL